MRIFFLCGTDDASVQDAAFRIASLCPMRVNAWNFPAPN
jgi:hypothetical protein